MCRLVQSITLAVLLAGAMLQASCTKPEDTSWDSGKLWKDWESNRTR